ncbi:MAG: deoxyguanosinetriphosphate triphosphohydrolase [Anaerolineae bacterium]
MAAVNSPSARYGNPHDLPRTRAHLDRHEATWLAPYAERSATSRGRTYAADPHPYRSEFQKDRDRIMYTSAYRRLQYKTQVFVNYEGDYYRTRLTHTNEAAQIARTVARALGANEDLAEAITLAHDLGHSPFGHSGEVTLDRLVLDRGGLDADNPANRGRGFNHTVQSLRIVEVLEHRWRHHPGLNLTWETREGIAKHATEYDAVGEEFLAPFEPGLLPSLEAQIVNFADELTYSAHDLDDGLRSGMLGMAMPELTRLDIWSLASTAAGDDDDELRRHKIVRRIVDVLISSLVNATSERIMDRAPQSPDDVRRAPETLVCMDPATEVMQRELKDFLFEHLYRHYRVVRMFRKAERVLEDLFVALEEDYRQLPPRTRGLILQAQPDIRPLKPLTGGAYQVLVDYLAGMTDRYALQEHGRLFDPLRRA